MLRKRQFFILTMCMLGIFIIIINYILKVLNSTESEVRKLRNLTIPQEILEIVPSLSIQYNIKQIVHDNITSAFIYNLKIKKPIDKIEQVWKKASTWIGKKQLYDISNSHLGNVMYALKTSKIVKADVDKRGTQLKLLLTLEGGQQAVFKPKWYPVDHIVEGPVYAGKDRYGSEILAFYLSAILEKPMVALATERIISLKGDIVPVASQPLLDTVFEKRAAVCLYGKCYYCKKEDPICDDTNKKLIGAIILNLNISLRTSRSPWQRTYKSHKKAAWESSSSYCRTVKGILSTSRILDLTEVSIFDFFIQNGDRHHYETLNGYVVLLDNGKGLGNPNIDHIDILAPLYQCCMLRSTMWNRLQLLSGGFIKDTLLQMPDIHNFITEQHLIAIERRLLIVYAAVEYCKKKNKIEHILF